MKNDRLNHAGYLWAFAAPNGSPGAKAHYRRRRDIHGDWHAAALRNLFNGMIGQLHRCLQETWTETDGRHLRTAGILWEHDPRLTRLQTLGQVPV